LKHHASRGKPVKSSKGGLTVTKKKLLKKTHCSKNKRQGGQKKDAITVEDKWQIRVHVEKAMLDEGITSVQVPKRVRFLKDFLQSKPLKNRGIVRKMLSEEQLAEKGIQGLYPEQLFMCVVAMLYAETAHVPQI